MPRICEQCGSDNAKLYCYWPAVLCPDCVKSRNDGRADHAVSTFHDAHSGPTPEETGREPEEQLKASPKPLKSVVRTVPNVDPVTGDAVLAPVLLHVPMVLIECDNEKHWHHEVMDRSAAERLVQAICFGNRSARIIEIPVIMPCPGDIADALSDFDCRPIRADIVETVTENPFLRALYELRARGEEGKSNGA